MSVKAFREQLARRAIGPGSTWLKTDFHVHAPTSSDYEYKESNAAAALGGTLRDKKYSLAVILKHQEFPTREELDSLQAHCPDTTLIPGAEINIIVDALFKKIGKDYFFHCIVAVDPSSEGDFSYVLRKAQEAFTYRAGDYPAGFRSSIVDVGHFFRKHGALFIPAHLHQGKKAEVSRSIDDLYDDEAFLGFVADGAFDALEIRQESTAQFFTGSRTTIEGVQIPAATCVASSDAHSHQHVLERNRATWIQAERRSFPELAAALSFRHRVRLHEPETRHARILGMHVVGSFISEIWICLNNGLNALIGSKGAGKTALVECARFVLNTTVPNERKEAVGRHVAHVLGSSGYVECLVQQADGAQLLVTRRADSPDRITILDEKGDLRTINANEEVGFPISILGWHEIEAVADQPEARISLLDRIENAAPVRSLYEQIKTQVDKARDQLPVLQRQVKKLDMRLRDLWELQRKRAALSRLERGDLVVLQQEYEWYLSAEQRLEALRLALTHQASKVPEALTSQLVLGILPPPQSDRAPALNDALIAIENAIGSVTAAETTAVSSLQGCLENVSVAAAASAQQFASSFASFRDGVYTPRVNALPQEDREILTKQIQVLEDTKRLPLIEKQCSDLLAEVRSLANELTNNCEAIGALRDQIVQRRESLVASLNTELLGVRLKFLRSANRNAVTRFQQRYGAEGAMLVGFVQRFGKAEAYENLKELFAKLADLQLEQDKWWEVDKVLFDIKFVDLLDVFDEDDVEILLNVGKVGFVPIQNLSAGQRCVAVFPLLLRNTKGPLVIDQPEDNLDNRYIADIISPDLLSRKQQQQFLVTSHNANLVVLTDADLIIHVDSDGAQSSFPTVGFLACAASPVRQSVLDVLDGGEAALAARQRKYGTKS
jgi:DNA repair ATPase RecN